MPVQVWHLAPFLFNKGKKFMTFEKLLEIHKNNLFWIKRRMAAEDDKIDYWQGAIAMEGIWFGQLKSECDDYNPTQWIRPATEEDKVDFSFDDDKPEAILTYRGHKLPIYIDDYGQCYFTRFDDTMHSGGTYNTAPEYEFCDFADRIIDEELLK